MHGNTSHMLPLGRGLAEQKAYIRPTLDLIAPSPAQATGWSVQAFTPTATRAAIAAEGITYTIDQMDSDNYFAA